MIKKSGRMVKKNHFAKTIIIELSSLIDFSTIRKLSLGAEGALAQQYQQIIKTYQILGVDRLGYIFVVRDDNRLQVNGLCVIDVGYSGGHYYLGMELRPVGASSKIDYQQANNLLNERYEEITQNIRKKTSDWYKVSFS